eukprot:365296-Chlamydomonas_euryale.AAC.36
MHGAMVDVCGCTRRHACSCAERRKHGRGADHVAQDPSCLGGRLLGGLIQPHVTCQSLRVNDTPTRTVSVLAARLSMRINMRARPDTHYVR